MTAINATARVIVTKEYDTNKYNSEELGKVEKKLSSHLVKHKEIINQFIKLYFFENRDRLGKAIKELSGKYTKEVESAFSGMVAYFQWQLPEQAQLDSYDAFVGKEEKKEEKKHGLEAVLELLNNKATKGRKEERDYYKTAYLAVLKASEKEESKK